MAPDPFYLGRLFQVGESIRQRIPRASENRPEKPLRSAGRDGFPGFCFAPV
jgi:hypothetical protein